MTEGKGKEKRMDDGVERKVKRVDEGWEKNRLVEDGK